MLLCPDRKPNRKGLAVRRVVSEMRTKTRSLKIRTNTRKYFNE